MTNKIQTMLTIALTAAVTVLLVDRIIEPAYAQDCATESSMEDEFEHTIEYLAALIVNQRVTTAQCLGGSIVNPMTGQIHIDASCQTEPAWVTRKLRATASGMR